MRLISILLKYGPWRDALLAAYKQTRGVPARLDVHARAERILDILISTCEAMDGVIPEAWIEHLGHSVSHCSGPVPMLTSWQVLRPVACGRLGVKKLRFGKQPRFKRVCRGKYERAKAVEHIARYVRMADEIGDLHAPRTCQDWVDSHERVVGMLQKQGKSGVRLQARLPQKRRSE